MSRFLDVTYLEKGAVLGLTDRTFIVSILILSKHFAFVASQLVSAYIQYHNWSGLTDQDNESTKKVPVSSDPKQLGPCYKRCPSWFTAVSDLVMVE